MFTKFNSLVYRSNHFHLNLQMQGNGVVYVFDCAWVLATFQTFLVWTWPCCVEDNIYYRSFDLSDLINHDIRHKWFLGSHPRKQAWYMKSHKSDAKRWSVPVQYRVRPDASFNLEGPQNINHRLAQMWVMRALGYVNQISAPLPPRSSAQDMQESVTCHVPRKLSDLDSWRGAQGPYIKASK